MEGLLSDLETPKRFSPEQLRTFTSNFSIRLGSGGFGDVYKGTLDNGVQVAVKLLKGALMSDGVKDQFKAEVSVLGKIHYKHVVKLYGFCFELNMKALVYEFMENGSLDKLLYGNQIIAWETLCNIAVGTAKGLAYLHEGCQPRILHYNVKPTNILIDSKFSPKVGDFGLAKLLNQDATHITESRFRGTPNYVAPELLMPYSPVTDKCDVFSFGITLFDIIGRQKQVWGMSEKWFPVQVWKKFKEEKQEEIMQDCDIQEKDRKQAKRILLIALQCVQFSPGDRPSMSRVVRLLEGTEEVKLPPNPFIYLGSSSEVTEEDDEDNFYPTILGGDGWSLWDDEKSSKMKTVERLFKDLEIENTKRFSYEELKTVTSDLSESLGAGTFGDVYKGVLLTNDEQVAVKVLKVSDGIYDQFKAELSVLCKIHHKNVVRLYGFCFEHNMKALVYEFMENGSLDKLLYGNQSIELEALCNIASGIAKGLSYLHEGCQPGIIHYDIKPANILLDSKFSPKVGDFGLAKRLIHIKTHITESRVRGTDNYIAPELHQPFSTPITVKCDVYSFGMMLFDIIGRRKISAGWGPIQVWKMFDKKQEEKVMEECGIRENDRELATRILLIALRCVQFAPDDRPSMSRVVTLLDGREVITMPRNPFWFLDFSSTESASKEVSSSTVYNSAPSSEVEGVSKRKIIKPYEVKEGDRDSIMESKCVGPWGEIGGMNWDDGVYSGVKQIQLFREEMKICAIQIEYSGKNGESIWSERHGTSGAPTIDKIKFDYPREILVRVSGFYYQYSGWEYALLKSLSFFTNKNKYALVKSLSFFTNKDKYGPFGEERGDYFSSGKDGKVVGFHGRCGASLDAIGVHMEYSSL